MGFLTDLVSLDGRNAIVGIKPDDTVHRWLDFGDKPAVVDAIKRLQRQKYDVYFALASYAPKTRQLTPRGGRLVDNVVSLKSFWLDIDAGPEKVRKARAMKSERARERKLANLYQTYDEAKTGLVEALGRTKLPGPTHVVKSGNGLHVYWAITEPLFPAEWELVQQALNDRLRAAGLRIDPSRALDTASILRPPGTVHRGASEAAGRLVHTELAISSDPIPLEELVAGIRATKLHGKMAASPANRAATPEQAKAVAKAAIAPTKYGVTQEMIDASNARVERTDPPETVENIALLLELLAVIPPTLGYDEWRNVVWAIKATKWECAEEIASEWSKEASETYADWEETLHKVWRSDGAGSRSGKAVGVGTLFALAEQHGLPNKHFFYNGETTTGSVVKTTLRGIGEVEYHVPPMPDGFWRSKETPGLWTRMAVVNPITGETEEWEDIQFYDNDLFITDRVNGEGGKFRLSMVHYLPNDGVKRLDVPLTTLGTVSDMRNELIEYNVIANGDKGWVHMSRYLQEQAKMYTKDRAATARVETMGWQRDGSFVIGQHAIERDKSVKPVVAAPTLTELLEITEPEGDLNEWKRIAGFYNSPGFEPAQMAIALSMAAPIYAFTGYTGGVVNLYSEGSGVGKTSVLRVAASVWGDPGTGMAPTSLIFGNTTENSMVHHMGRMGTLPAMYDEITADVGDRRKMDSLRSFIRYSTHSTDKQRMKSGANELRKNTAHHTNFALCTANRPLESIFPDMSADAERARTLDIPCANMPKLEMFGVSVRESLQAFGFGVSTNSGLAGRVLLDYYLDHYDAVRERVLDMQLRFRDAGTTSRDRFVVALCASAVVACEVANELGLVAYDPQVIFDYGMALIGAQHSASRAGTVGDDEILNEFIRQNSEHLLLTKVLANGSHVLLGGRTPRDPCMGRWHTNTNLLYIVRRDFVRFCNENRIDSRRAIDALKNRDALVHDKRQEYLGTGITGYNPGRHQCMVVNTVAAGLDSPQDEGDSDE